MAPAAHATKRSERKTEALTMACRSLINASRKLAGTSVSLVLVKSKNTEGAT